MESAGGTKGTDDEDLALSLMVALATTLGLCERARAQSGYIYGWGSNQSDVLTTIPEGAKWTQVGAGDGFAIALNVDGTLAGWGNTADGRTTVPTNGPYTQIAVGWDCSFALRANGAVDAWGNHATTTMQPPAGLVATVIAAGETFGLAIRGDAEMMNQVVAWGSADVVADVPSGQFVEIAAGGHFAMARRADGTIAVWGGSTHPECRNLGATPLRLPPTVIPTGVAVDNQIVSIAAGHCSAYAIDSAGLVWAWGGAITCSQTLVSGSMFTQVAGGYGHGVGKLPNGRVETWGPAHEPLCPPDNCCPLTTYYVPVPSALDSIPVIRLYQSHSARFTLVIIPWLP
ncbi:MAG: RCC1 domain-containing protein [Phycisphaerales bacterium]